MRRVPVVVAGWEIECCRPQPAVGDRVSWQLVFEDAVVTGHDDDPATAAGVVDLDVDVEPLGGPRTEPFSPRGEPEYASIVHSGSVSALRRLTRPAYGPEHVHGVLSSDTHDAVLPADLVPTCGRVERGQVVSRRFHRVRDGRCWIPEPGWSALRDVRRSPRWFTSTTTPAATTGLRETAVLVTLLVA